MEPRTARLDAIRPFRLAPGTLGRPFFGERAMLNLAEVGPGETVDRHRHPEEQIGLVLRGRITLVVAGTPLDLGPMDAVAIPPDTEHGGTAGPDGCTMLDVFAPPRDDYRARWEESAGDRPDG